MMWDRHLWGVMFISSGQRHPNRPMLIGRGWHAAVETPYTGEPTRALLFTTRAAARWWCQAKVWSYAGRSDSCRLWRFRVVRVRETVRVVKRRERTR